MNNRKWQPDVVTTPGPTPTQQQYAKDADINNIVARYKKTGVLGTPNVNGRKALFGDFTRLDFQEMKNAIVDVEQQFLALPGRTRRRFNNDPAQMLAFIEDPKNAEQAAKMGLIPVPEGLDLDQVDLLDLNEQREKDKAEKAEKAQKELDALPFKTDGK